MKRWLLTALLIISARFAAAATALEALASVEYSGFELADLRGVDPSAGAAYTFVPIPPEYDREASGRIFRYRNTDIYVPGRRLLGEHFQDHEHKIELLHGSHGSPVPTEEALRPLISAMRQFQRMHPGAKGSMLPGPQGIYLAPARLTPEINALALHLEKGYYGRTPPRILIVTAEMVQALGASAAKGKDRQALYRDLARDFDAALSQPGQEPALVRPHFVKAQEDGPQDPLEPFLWMNNQEVARFGIQPYQELVRAYERRSLKVPNLHLALAQGARTDDKARKRIIAFTIAQLATQELEADPDLKLILTEYAAVHLFKKIGWKAPMNSTVEKLIRTETEAISLFQKIQTLINQWVEAH